MTDYRGDHSGAVQAAIYAVGELQDVLAMATDRCEMAIGACIGATGASEVESAQNAMNALQGVKDEIDRLFGMTNVAKEELIRYGGGF